MKSTIHDVAKTAGVSETTVSLAFRRGSRISKATSEKVLRVAMDLNYVPNQAARMLRGGGWRVLGVLVNDLTNPFYARIVRTIEAQAALHGYQVIIMESQWDPEKELDCIRRMIEARVQGALVCLSEYSNEGLEVLERSSVPCVVLDTYPLGYNGSYVANDLILAGQVAAKHLVEIGCRNPAIVVPKRGHEFFSSFARLHEGFSESLQDNGIEFDRDNIFPASLTIEDGLAVFEEIRLKQPSVDGILCGNDLCALGIMEAIENSGGQVGRDIAVMGIDDLPVSGLAKISLTSIQQPHETLSIEATRAILDSIGNKECVTLQKTLPPKLIERDSTLMFRKH